MTADRNRGTAPVFRAFRELACLPPAERNEALMLRLEHLWDEAQGRTYTNKRGDQIPNPDGTLQLKVIQAVAVLQGMTGQAAEAEQAALAKMSDADLLRAATKRLPPHELNALADALIAMREQQTEKQAILTTGETNDEQQENEDASRPEPDQPRVPKPNPKQRRRPAGANRAR